jgi:NADH:ubiquinone oxidoreductase subunit 6 (subunit J)
MSMSSGGYEFTGEQNTLIGSLASKMNFLGLLSVILGVLNILMAILLVVAVYRDRIPAEWKSRISEYTEKGRQQLPEDVRKQSEQYTLDKLPPNNHLWGYAINTGIVGLFYLMLGTWTRSAAASFRKIVTTHGQDIRNLMEGMSALHSMYSLLFTLAVVVLVFGLIGLGLTLYNSFVA